MAVASPHVRTRLERNMEYHADLERHYKNILQPEENGERSEQQAEPSDKELEEAETLAKMHGEAAKMLRDLLGEDAEPVITDAMTNRPVIRRVN